MIIFSKQYLLFIVFYGIILKTVAQQNLNNLSENNAQLTQIEENITSTFLEREVHITLICPKNNNKNLNVLVFNDGQDFLDLSFYQTISNLFSQNIIKPFLCVGIHANHNRLYEYGTASQADYKNRGSKAKPHTDFIIHELLPYLEKKYSVKNKGNVIAGLSLGGLSAMDIGWNNPERFSKIGVFSGSFWWRQKSGEDGYTDENDRIMHNIVRAGTYKKGMEFWFEAGTNDEESDRNNNGIIDAIDDTLDLITELEHKGYLKDKDMIYREVQGGKHNTNTWKMILPEFLIWAFGK